MLGHGRNPFALGCNHDAIGCGENCFGRKDAFALSCNQDGPGISPAGVAPVFAAEKPGQFTRFQLRPGAQRDWAQPGNALSPAIEGAAEVAIGQ